MKRYIRCTPLLLTALMLSGCGLTQSVSDGTQSVATSIFYKQVKTLHLDFTARDELNPDDDGTALATDVWVYQLKDRKTFDKADYATLLTDASNVLKADLLAEKDAWIRPGAYSALFDHEFAWNIDQGFASIRSSLGFNFSSAF